MEGKISIKSAMLGLKLPLLSALIRRYKRLIASSSSKVMVLIRLSLPLDNGPPPEGGDNRCMCVLKTIDEKINIHGEQIYVFIKGREGITARS